MVYKTPDNYYERFDPKKKYKKLLFRAGQSFISTPLNENLKPQVRDVKDVPSVWDVLRGNYSIKE